VNVARPIRIPTIEGVTISIIVSTLVILEADKGVANWISRLQVNRNSDCRGTYLCRAISGSYSVRDRGLVVCVGFSDLESPEI
jgi:hypothetical protein